MERVGTFLIICSMWLIIPDLFAQDPEYELGSRVEKWEEQSPFIGNDLNEADENMLMESGLINKEQIDDLLNYKRKYGDLLSVYELQSLPSFSVKDIQRLVTKFSLVEKSVDYIPSRDKDRIKRQTSNYILFRIKYHFEKKKGQETDAFAGNLPYGMIRLQYKINPKLNFGLTFENDEGEALLWYPANNHFGTDFSNGYLQWTIKKNSKIIIGNYLIHFGQGLVCQSGFALGKGSQAVLGIPGQKSGIRPYSSLSESGSLRGIAWTLPVSTGITWVQGVSVVRQDASIKSNRYHTTQESGLHRTSGEIKNENTLKDQTVFSELMFSPTSYLNMGILYRADFMSAIHQPSGEWYDVYSWKGNIHQNISLSFERNKNNIYFWSELAFSQWQTKAWQAGMIIQASPQFSSSVVLRMYDPGFNSFQGNALGEQSGTPKNERGMYWGLEYINSKKWKINTYLDVFVFPWSRANVFPPGEGHEIMIRYTYTPDKLTGLTLKFQEETKPINASSSAIKASVEQHIWQFLAHLSYKISRQLEIRSRVQMKMVKVADTMSHGSMAYQELIYSPSHFTFSNRISLFKTEGFISRIYSYERDVWGAFSLPSYYGTGLRYYFLMRWKASRNLDFWIRFTRTVYVDRDIQGSGVDEIDKPFRNDITFQVKLKL